MLTRRNVIAFTGAVLAAAAVPAGASSGVRRISTDKELPSDVPYTEAAKWHATLDGKAVCAQCFFADSTAGIVGLFSRDYSGHFYLAGPMYKHGPEDTTDYGAAVEMRYGRVELLPPGTDCDCGTRA